MRGLRPGMLWTAIPFALLVNSAQVRMGLEIKRDGTARRIISADVAPYFKSQVPKWINDVQAGHPWDRTWKKDAGTTYLYARDYSTQSPSQAAVNGELKIDDVFQNPLSIYTTYTWHEEVTFSYLYATDPSAASAAGKQLLYEIDMPGRVMDASVRPGKSGGSEAKPAETATPEAADPGLGVLLMGAAYAQPAAPATEPAAPPSATPAPTPSPAAGQTAPAAAAETPPAAGQTQPSAATETPPAVVVDAPAKGGGSSVEVLPGSAIFKLDASQESVTVDATSHRVRWGYLAIVAYVLAFIAFKVLEGLQRAARLRPRKI